MIKWGIIGLGKIAENFALAFKEVSNAKLIGIASKNLEKLNKFKNNFKIEEKFCFKDYQNLIECNEVDIIYIALPHNFHHEWILNSLKEKKSVLSEKPAVINSKQITEINNHLNQNKIFFAEGFMYRFHPQTKEIVKIIKNNSIGELISMESYFGKNIIEKKNIFGFKKTKINKDSRLFNKNLAGGSILDLGCYPSSMSILISDLKSITNKKNVLVKNKKVEIGPTDVDMESYAELDFNNGFKSKIGCSFKTDMGKRTVIHGSKGILEIDDTWHCSSDSINLNGKKYKLQNLLYENLFSYEIESVSKSILEGKTDPEYPGIDRNSTAQNIDILEKWKNK